MTNNKTAKRVFLDTVTLALLAEPIAVLKNLINDGHQLVIPNTVLDVKCFQENPQWVMGVLESKDLVIQIFMAPAQMVSKPFFWSSCGQETQAADSFEEAIKDLPNKNDILAVKELMDKYGIPKGEWEMGQWAPAEPLWEEARVTLGLDEADSKNRTAVLEACRKADRMDIFDVYNVGYNKGLACQHMCQFILNSDGTLAEI